MRQKQSKTGAHSGSDTALLLIDFINDLEFPGAKNFFLRQLPLRNARRRSRSATNMR
ncbi:MAG: hypothetical protein ACREV2_19135 [Burkholderiales bacterium]